MNKMASDIVDRWLIIASDEDESILSADFSGEEDMDVLGARVPESSNYDGGPKGKASNKLYGKGVNKSKYKWTPEKKEECWGFFDKDNPGTRQKEMAKRWKMWSNNSRGVKDKHDSFTAYFNHSTKALRNKMLCYHKNKGAPGTHKDLKGVPKAKKGKGVNNKAYNQGYWKKRLKTTKKTANEEMVANIIDRYEP